MTDEKQEKKSIIFTTAPVVLLIVAVIIALAGLSVNKLTKEMDKERVEKCNAVIDELKGTIEKYNDETGKLPEKLDLIVKDIPMVMDNKLVEYNFANNDYVLMCQATEHCIVTFSSKSDEKIFKGTKCDLPYSFK